MYLENIILENAGPIDQLEFTSQFNNAENPKPVILVGENGAGKSIFLSYLVNGLMAAQQLVYSENTEVEAGKVFKLRSPSYIRSGAEYSFGRIGFRGGHSYFEWQLKRSRKDYEEQFQSTPARREWNEIKDNDTNHYKSDFKNSNKELNQLFETNVILYFPPSRFEEPAWLNLTSMNARAEFPERIELQGFANRRIINSSPLKDNKNWLLDILFDRTNFEARHAPLNTSAINGEQALPPQLMVFLGFQGPSSSLVEAALTVLRTIVRDETAMFSIGVRGRRQVGLTTVMKTLPNVFQMSSGETSLLNLFLSILRDFDSCGASFSSLSDVRGIVVVDEIDLHLHTIHQRKVLPDLMKLFPKVQFLVTTHSPLFILGLEDAFGRDGFSLVQMPTGKEISVEQFSEFGEAYESFRKSQRHLREIQAAIEESRKPLLFVEGELDIDYLKRAAELLGATTILDRIEVRDGGGFGGLGNIWKHFNSKLCEVTPQRILLLYDCDISKQPSTKGNVFRRVMATRDDNPIPKGIENLFTKATLERAIEHKTAFIDITSAHVQTLRGHDIEVAETWVVNEDEKRNLCNWLIEKGTLEDFAGFGDVFDLIEDTLFPVVAPPAVPAAN